MPSGLLERSWRAFLTYNKMSPYMRSIVCLPLLEVV